VGNNKGFMMAEVVVVSSVVLVTLVSFYVSYNKIISLYNQRINYYDIATLYDLAYVRDGISDYSDYNSKDAIISDTYDKVYYVNNQDLDKLDVENQTFKDYLEYIDSSVNFETDNILVMEKCINNDIDNCRYAYLEVYIEPDDPTPTPTPTPRPSTPSQTPDPEPDDSTSSGGSGGGGGGLMDGNDTVHQLK